jgi:2-octaprenyl-6-methoxyphenol hydroxylase
MPKTTPAASATRHVQSVVVGGGLVGLASAVILARAGVDVLHVAPKAPPDRRTSALMMPSVDFLRESGLVEEPAVIGHPLRQIRIIDATSRLLRAPETLFDSAEAGLDAFGWNFPNVALAERFTAAAKGLANLSVRETTLTGLALQGDGAVLTLGDGEIIATDLLVGADGKKSLVRNEAGLRAHESAFAQAALVLDLDLGRPLGSCSVEFHYPDGPFTLVPAGGARANLVWIDQRAVLESARDGGPDYLRARLAEKAMHLFGSMSPSSRAHIFPLSTLSVETAGKDGVVLVGEAAHAFPPIGAQGLNLGLRDVADLAAAITELPGRGVGWGQAVSAAYARRRADDLSRTTGMVDALFKSLLTDMLPAQAARAGGLWALKLVPSLRHRAFALGMGAH